MAEGISDPVPGGPAPEAGGPVEVFGSERASATPIAPVEDAVASAAEGPPVSPPLSALEAWFAAVITHPESASAGVAASAGAFGARAVEQIVTPGPKLTAVQRLGLYQFAYHARLVECLADDYPVVKHALGEHAFEALARRYIEAHPSRGPNLNRYGLAFADFAARASTPFISELARLEWALVEVVHARAAPVLAPDMLQQLPQASWPDVRLRASSTLRFLESTYPVNRYLQAVRRDESPALPAPEPSATAVYRRGFVVWRMDFTPPMAGVLRALLAGETLGDALATLAPYLESGTLENDVMVWFREWVAGGFFAQLELPST